MSINQKERTTTKKKKWRGKERHGKASCAPENFRLNGDSRAKNKKHGHVIPRQEGNNVYPWVERDGFSRGWNGGIFVELRFKKEAKGREEMDKSAGYRQNIWSAENCGHPY